MPTGYLGSSKIETSIANQEVITYPPLDWTMNYHILTLSFLNFQDCNIIINNDANIFLQAYQGIYFELTDPTINSLKIVQAGINYLWIAIY